MVHYAPPKKTKNKAGEVDVDERPCCVPKLIENFKNKAKGITTSKGMVRWECFHFAIKGGEPEFTLGEDNEYYDLLVDGKWEMVTSDKYPKEEKAWERAWKEAIDRINNDGYNFFTFNCAHLVTEILTGEGYCHEYRRVACSSTATSTKSASKRSSTSSPSPFNKKNQKE